MGCYLWGNDRMMSSNGERLLCSEFIGLGAVHIDNVTCNMMSNPTILPNELLHYIVAFVAYIPEPPSCRHLEPFYQFTSAELSS